MRANGVSVQPPRLDTPDRLLLWPRDRVLWTFFGLFSGPIIFFIAFLFGAEDGLFNGYFLAFSLVMLALSIGMAFYRPGGLNIAQWLSRLADYALCPKNSVWWKD